MSINQLTQQAITSGGMIPFADPNGGGDRRISVNDLATFIATLNQGAGTSQTQYAAPSATGFSIQIAPTTIGANVYLILTPTAGFAAGTIVLPASPSQCVDGQIVTVSTTQAVTTLTVNGNGAVAVNGAPTTLAAGAFFRLRYDLVGKAWYRIG